SRSVADCSRIFASSSCNEWHDVATAITASTMLVHSARVRSEAWLGTAETTTSRTIWHAFAKDSFFPARARSSLRRTGTWRLGNLSTPKRVQKLQKALHAKAKAEAATHRTGHEDFPHPALGQDF